jgi:crotonobetainyl-CoA:carnitine CoA-transferase CaiB-like acyl-CoA transferase
VLVVACEQAVAAPLATRRLADLGARIIKVERPDGGDLARSYDTTVKGQSSHFVWLNRGKQSVVLDLKEAGQADALGRILARADVFVQNLAPGAAGRLGLGSDELRTRHPVLITCDISGYGDSGPYVHAKAYDALIQAEAGLMSITGTEESPAKAGIAVADIAAGMDAYAAILAALFERTRTGVGSALRVSLFDSLVEWMGYPLYYADYGGQAPQRTGTSHASIAPYGEYRAASGDPVMLAIQNEREWVRFCAVVLELPALAGDPRFGSVTERVRHRIDLDGEITTALAGVPGEDFLDRLARASIAHSRRRDLGSVLAHPQIVARDRLTEVGSPSGPLWALRPPVLIDGDDLPMDDIPALGADTHSVLAEFLPSLDDERR